MNNPLEMTAAYLEGKLNADQVAAFEAYLREDSNRAKAFVRQAMLDSHLSELLREQNVAEVAAGQSDDSAFGMMLGQAELRELVRMEAAAEIVTLPEQPDDAPKKVQDPNALTAHDFAAAGSYVLRKIFTNKKVITTGMTTAAAAIILLALILINPFASDAPDTIADPDFWDDPETTQPGPAIPQPSVVATLTAERDAVWDRRPGEDLYANQRLTLTAGTATITTHDGAIAILQAPATIQLINHNALHLHTGKLVGICETESSKGFLVRTEHLDITDLGTRFGVDATRSEATEVHVYEGIVEVGHASTTHATPAKPQRLIAGQALRGSANVDTFTPIETDPTRFAAIMPTRIELPGTGQGLALNDTDPNWRVTAIDGKPLDTPGAMTVRDAHGASYQPPFLPNDPQTSQWLIIDKRLGQSGTGQVTFTCQSRFEIPPGVDASAARLIVSFDADDSVTAVRINGQAVTVPKNEFVDDSRDLHAMTIRRHLIAGQNTIEFDIMDRRSLGFANSGLRVKLSLQPN